MSRSPIVLTMLSALSLAFSSCADRSLDDFNSDNLQQELSKLRSAEGSFVDVLYSENTGDPMGALRIDLTPEVKVTPGSRSTRASLQPLLTTRVEITTNQKMVLSYDEAYFDPVTKVYQASIPVPAGTNSAIRSIQIEGTIDNGVFEGHIYAPAYKDLGGRFKLVRNGEIPADLASRLRRARESAPKDGTLPADSQVLNGYTHFLKDDVKKPVSFILIQPNTSPENELANLFAPTRSVQVALNYGNSVSFPHNGGVLDLRAQTIKGSTDRMELACFRQTGRDGWVCNHITKTGALSAVSYISANANTSLPEGNDQAAAINLAYQGTSTLDGVETEATMTVTFPARTREQEIRDLFEPAGTRLVQVGLKYRTYVQRNFTNVIWEQVGLTLKGTGKNGIADEALTCQNFNLFNPDATEVSCTLNNSQLGKPIIFKLRPVAAE